MYSQIPSKIEVEPRIKFKYVDEEGKTIDIKHMNDSIESNSSSKVSSNKSFRRYLMNQNTPPPKEIKGKFIMEQNLNMQYKLMSSHYWFTLCKWIKGYVNLSIKNK